MSELTIVIADETKVDDAWILMQEFHASVASFLGEMQSTGKAKLLKYWRPTNARIIFLEYSGAIPVGICLLQEFAKDFDAPKCLELGAIYLREEFRKGFNAQRMYCECINLSHARLLPLVSEVSPENKKILQLVRALGKRNTKSKASYVEHILDNGRIKLVYQPCR